MTSFFLLWHALRHFKSPAPVLLESFCVSTQADDGGVGETSGKNKKSRMVRFLVLRLRPALDPLTPSTMGTH